MSDTEFTRDPEGYRNDLRRGARFGYPRRGAGALTTATVVWALYLAGAITGGVTTLIGLVVAYAAKGGSSDAAWSHYVFAIRTIWVGLAWVVIGAVLAIVGTPLTLILIGFLFWKAALLIWGLIGLWYLARSVMGLVYAIRDEPYPRPRSWLI